MTTKLWKPIHMNASTNLSFFVVFFSFQFKSMKMRCGRIECINEINDYFGTECMSWFIFSSSSSSYFFFFVWKAIYSNYIVNFERLICYVSSTIYKCFVYTQSTGRCEIISIYKQYNHTIIFVAVVLVGFVPLASVFYIQPKQYSRTRTNSLNKFECSQFDSSSFTSRTKYDWTNDV